MRLVRALVVAMACGCLGWAAPAAAAPPPPGGIYVIADSDLVAAGYVAGALKVKGVDGVLIHLRWGEISTGHMTYDWSFLDQVATMATKAGKRFELGIVAGGAQPKWLIDSARHGTFHYDASAGPGCTTLTMVAPYAAVYVAAFRDLLRQLSAHLHSTGGYAALSMLKLDAISTTTDELRLPALDQCTGNTVAEWQRLGYTPAKVQSAWAAMLAAYLRHFPDKAFDIGFIGINAFPGIGARGQAVATATGAAAASARLAGALIAAADSVMPGRLALGFDSLTLQVADTKSYHETEHGLFANAAAAGAMLGWQTNELLGQGKDGGAACAEAIDGTTTPCTNTTFREMLFRGIYPQGRAGTPPARRAIYLELFPQNITAFPEAVLAAHQALAGGD